MDSDCLVKSDAIISALSVRGFDVEKGGAVYICYKCSAKLCFHSKIVKRIKNKHGQKECLLCTPKK